MAILIAFGTPGLFEHDTAVIINNVATIMQSPTAAPVSFSMFCFPHRLFLVSGAMIEKSLSGGRLVPKKY
jgi:hypothetical protein